MWGDKGLLATHIAFEMGVAVMLVPLRFRRAYPNEKQLGHAITIGHRKLFVERAKEIDEMQMYQLFYKSGWTPRLASIIRKELAPTIVNTVTLIWYLAALEASR
jgi:hypothetical protein